ncbi:hypothetical protein EXN66_Car012071 [Channa argus]|uniref:Uncharacterized protein n=1 Tax=Channa argus TaxID=215402 RepID=A0A6G1Q1X7_CHAAH|nr:hypothetical protein EXN66_Car012071 [Channa argus]
MHLQVSHTNTGLYKAAQQQKKIQINSVLPFNEHDFTHTLTIVFRSSAKLSEASCSGGSPKSVWSLSLKNLT